jgi:glucose/arabinose dehydrogenase
LRGTAVAVVLGVLATLVAPVLAQAAPSGFSVQAMPFSGLIEPSGVEFAANGQVFVAERRGVIKVFDNLDDASSAQVADLRLRVFNNGDRGLLGMALDPQYPVRPYLWALYTKDADPVGAVPKYGSATSDTDPCPNGGANDCRVTGELSRLTLNPQTGVWSGQEKVLLTGWCQQYGSHSIGDLQFGGDGYLYVSAGDGASYNQVDVGTIGSQRCPDPAGYGGALRSQSPRRPADLPQVWSGSVLRIQPDTGDAAPGNPYLGDANAEKQRVLAYGMRNPFRMTPRPGSPEMWVGDVGWSASEEINRIVVDGAAENFGWPCYEGGGRQSGYDAADAAVCESLYSAGASAVTAPAYAYSHSQQIGGACGSGSSSISALAFSTSTTYPAAYRGGLFFGDYARGCIWYSPVTGSTVGTPTAFEAGNVFPAELQVGPNGDVYIVDIGLGQIRRIAYTAGGNTPPIAIARANPTNGPTPLAVTFDGSGSGDPDPSSSITYAWDLDGDGQFDDSTAVSPTWTYTTAGAVAARLRVTDNLGATSVSTITITAGSGAPTAILQSSAATTPWSVGDTITFTASGTDVEDGTLPASALTTELIIKHCPGGANCHEHTQQTFPGASGSFAAPDHEYPSYLELRLTATDSSGLSGTTTMRLDPATVDLAFDTVPSGLQVVVGSESYTTPFSLPVIRNSVNSIASPTPQILGGTSYAFDSWSDGGARSHDIVASTSRTLTARFTSTGAPPAPAGLVGSWSFDEGSGTVATDSSGRGNTGTLGGGPTWTSSGRHGGALSFDGTNDWVTVADSASLDLTGPLTTTAWVRPASLGSWRQVVMKETSGGLAYALYANGESGNRPAGYYSIGGADRGVDAPAALASGTWTHLASSFDGTTMRMFVNGVQVASTPFAGSVPTSGSPLRIGGNGVWGEWFAGLIDEVRVYNRALSAAEVSADSLTGGAADTVPPTAPGTPAATAGVTSAALTWAPSTDDRGTITYQVHRSLVDGFSPTAANLVASGLTAASYTDSTLAAGTYYYRVVASDGTNLSPPSGQARVVIAGDSAPPSVPTQLRATVGGTTVDLAWTASTDDVGVTGYDLERTSSTQTSTAATTSPALRETGLAAGDYTYRVRAKDASGKVSDWSSAVVARVVVDAAPPSVQVTAPADGSTVSGSITLTATATDDVGVAGVQFKVDGANVGAEDTTAPYSLSWNTSTVANGARVVTAVARDTANRTTLSAPVSVTVANTGVAGLVAGWSFDEGTGLAAGDSSGNRNDGVLGGGVAWTAAGRYGGALTFDGVNDWVTVADSASLDLAGPMTMTAWVRPTTVGPWRQVLLKESATGLSYGLYATNASANRPNGHFSIGGADREVAGTSAIATNTWTHLAVTYDRSSMRLYVNGTLVRTVSRTGNVALSDGPLRIGGNAVWGEWFAGQIDDVRVYNRALGATEVVTVRDTRL